MASGTPIYRTYSCVIASGVTSSAEVDIDTNYDELYLFIPSANVGNTRLYMSTTLGGTYYPSANNAGTNEEWASSISGKFVVVTNHGRFNKIIASTAPADGATYTFVCFS